MGNDQYRNLRILLTIKRIHCPIVAYFLGIASLSAHAAINDQFLAEQQKHDEACERARAVAIKRAQKNYVEECVEKELKEDRAACERFYKTYGEASFNQGSLFYDLPQCIAAYQHKKSYRSKESRRAKRKDWYK